MHMHSQDGCCITFNLCNLSHLVSIPSGRNQEYPRKTHDFGRECTYSFRVTEMLVAENQTIDEKAKVQQLSHYTTETPGHDLSLFFLLRYMAVALTWLGTN